MGRLGERVKSVLPVRLYGMDCTGKPFNIMVRTVDISPSGARLPGVELALQPRRHCRITIRCRKGALPSRMGWRSSGHPDPVRPHNVAALQKRFWGIDLRKRPTRFPGLTRSSQQTPPVLAQNVVSAAVIPAISEPSWFRMIQGLCSGAAAQTSVRAAATSRLARLCRRNLIYTYGFAVRSRRSRQIASFVRRTRFSVWACTLKPCQTWMHGRSANSCARNQRSAFTTATQPESVEPPRPRSHSSSGY